VREVARELETLLNIADRLKALPDSAAALKPDPRTWSKKEILGHLVDSAANNHQRFVRMQLQPHLVLPGYEQDGWVRVQGYQNMEWRDIIELWQMYNRHLASLIRDVNPEALQNTWVDPEGKTVTLEFIMRDYLVHMKHHLDQIL
jgi:hypothetical protein